jgi:hypothetical protein
MLFELVKKGKRKDSGKDTGQSLKNFWLASFDLQYYIKKLEMFYPL